MRISFLREGKSCVEGPVAYYYEYSDYQNCVTNIEKLDFEVILYCEISRPVYKLWFLLKYIYMYIVSNFFVQKTTWKFVAGRASQFHRHRTKGQREYYLCMKEIYRYYPKTQTADGKYFADSDSEKDLNWEICVLSEWSWYFHQLNLFSVCSEMKGYLHRPCLWFFTKQRPNVTQTETGNEVSISSASIFYTRGIFKSNTLYTFTGKYYLMWKY